MKPQNGLFSGLATALRVTVILSLTCLLAGCLAPDDTAKPAPPKAAATARPAPSGPVATPPSQGSIEARAYYAREETRLLSQGLLRTDGGGPDTPFTARQLADNFIKIALFNEYVSDGTQLVPQTTETRLRRWNEPVRIGIEFGSSVPLSQRVRDRNHLAEYAQRLSRISGLQIRMDPVHPNFSVLVLNEDERKAIAPHLRALVPAIPQSDVQAITQMQSSTYCFAVAFSTGASLLYSKAIIVIRGEHPDLLRLSCIHEEVAQGLGLTNDSPRARPSIFNDDEEFALLTRQDEMMLKMLYDPRLKPGMTVAEARPIVEILANELVGGES